MTASYTRWRWPAASAPPSTRMADINVTALAPRIASTRLVTTAPMVSSASRTPTLVTIGVLTAVPTWNEYVLTRVSLNDESRYTLPLALEKLASGTVPSYNEIMAGSLILVVPVIVLFLALQRYFVNGLSGAVKN